MSDINQATLQWLNDLATQGILTTDAELRIRGWNRWLEVHSGFQAADVIGRSILEVYPELVERRLDQWYHQALNGQVMVLAQRLHRYLIPMTTSVGYSRLAQMQQSARIAPLIAQGRIIGTITVIEDVTEREAREDELRHQIAALQALHDLGRAILSLDLPECLKRLVGTTAALIQAPLVAVVLRHKERLQIEACAGESLPLDDARVNTPTSIAAAVVRSGQPLWIADMAAEPSLTTIEPRSRSVIATPLIVDQSVIGALVIESTEAQALSRADQSQVMILAMQAAIGIRNAQLYREAQEAIQTRDTFLSIASHELKTPLTTLLGNAQLLQRRSSREKSLSERDQRSLRVITDQAARLNKMIAALLDISRIQTGQLSIERGPLDLCALAQRVVDEVQPGLDKHVLELRVPDEPVIVEGDELRLEQVFQNLVQNAIKYSPSGGPIQITVEQRESEGRIGPARGCVLVSDQGLGIPQAALPKLFARFFRADNIQAQQISGMGVGLYVVKEIVALHSGEVEVESQEGSGSTFTICLPLLEMGTGPGKAI